MDTCDSCQSTKNVFKYIIPKPCVISQLKFISEIRIYQKIPAFFIFKEIYKICKF